ncbi:hypothetical protein J3Q64DRAFT_1720160 [Phycomyces blakesleeanus]|uniref:Uncharacterized protein n=1 Tax=Phycomyces blakesleeanus TaxID=4837 RepID=A0ABR3B9B3_PHYBL
MSCNKIRFVSVNPAQPATEDNVVSAEATGNSELEDAIDKEDVLHSKDNEDAEQAASMEDISEVSTSQFWSIDVTCLLLKVILQTDHHNLVKAAAFKAETDFENLSLSFKLTVDSNKCNTKFKLLKTSFKVNLDRVYAQTGHNAYLPHMCWFNKMREIMLNNLTYSIPCLVLTGTMSQGATITRTSMTGRITREHVETFQPLEILEEEQVVAEEPATEEPIAKEPPVTEEPAAEDLVANSYSSLPPNVLLHVAPAHDRLPAGDCYDSMLELMGSAYAAMREDIRVSTQELTEVFLGTAEEREEKKRGVALELELRTIEMNSFVKENEEKSLEHARRARLDEKRAVEHKRKTRRDNKFLADHKRITDLLSKFVNRNIVDSSTQSNDNGEA